MRRLLSPLLLLLLLLNPLLLLGLLLGALPLLLLLLLLLLLGALLLLLRRLLIPLLPHLFLLGLLGPLRLLLLLLRRLLGPLLRLLSLLGRLSPLLLLLRTPLPLGLALIFFLPIALRERRVNRPEKHKQGSRTDHSNHLHRNCPPLASLLGMHADGQRALTIFRCLGRLCLGLGLVHRPIGWLGGE